jgi:electron transfer flavoprotein beta subunit
LYRIIVLVKQVPDTKHVFSDAMKPDGTVNRAALATIFNPEDLHALEMALKIKDLAPSSEIHAITMGPASAAEVLRESIFRGADFGYLISDRRFAASDTLATSYVLSRAIEKIGKTAKIDLIFAGRQAIDGDTAQVGPQIAENLKIPQITYAEEFISIEKNKIVLKRQIENGYEILQGELPILVTVVDTAPHARVRDLERMVYRRKQTLATWGLEDIEADINRCGLHGSPTNVHKIKNVVLTSCERSSKVIEQDLASYDLLLDAIFKKDSNFYE